MRGQLTEQLPEDGNAEELYQQIQKEKQELIKEGKIKKQKPLPEITDEEIPFDIPKNWKWVYLGELFEHNTGKALKTSDQNGQLLEYITTSNLYWDHFELKKLKSMYFKESEIDKCTVKKGDLLICEGGDIGRSAIWTFDYEIRIQNHIHKLRKYSELIYTDFYYYLLWLYKQTDRISGIGIGLQGFSSKRVHSLIVPFVPYYEAVRVVLKVKKAFSVLDTIDKLQAQYADNLTALKSKLIDAAIQGKLTEQLPEDGTAEELYQQIQEEKQKLIKEGKIKKQKPLPEISDDEIPFDIPANWKWVHLGELFEHNTGKALKTSDQNGQLLEYITTSNLYWDHFVLRDLKKMYFKESEIDKCTVKKGDLLICEGGDIGRSAIWPFENEMLIQNHIHRLRSYGNFICVRFYYYGMWLYKHTGKINGVGIGLQGLSSKRLHSLVVPLPPLAEQKRIVQKLDEILPICERKIK